MKKLLLSLLFLSSIAFVSCDEGDLLETDRTAEGPKIAGFKTALANISHFTDIGVEEQSFAVSLRGLGNGQLPTSDVVLEYKVDVANSTATEGVEFDFDGASRTVIIPANSEVGVINLKINTGQFDPSQKTTLFLTLESATPGVVVGEQYKTLEVNFVGCQANVAGTYNVSQVRESNGAVSVRNNEVVTMTGTNTFKTTNTGTFNPGQAPDQGFTFNIVCGEIFVPTQGLFQGAFSNEVVGSPFTTGPNAGKQGYVVNANQFVVKYKANAGGATGFITWTATYTKI